MMYFSLVLHKYKIGFHDSSSLCISYTTFNYLHENLSLMKVIMSITYTVKTMILEDSCRHQGKANPNFKFEFFSLKHAYTFPHLDKMNKCASKWNQLPKKDKLWKYVNGYDVNFVLSELKLDINCISLYFEQKRKVHCTQLYTSP